MQFPCGIETNDIALQFLEKEKKEERERARRNYLDRSSPRSKHARNSNWEKERRKTRSREPEREIERSS